MSARRPCHLRLVAAEKPSTTDPRLDRALELLRAEPSRDWTVTDLAKRSGASRSTLVRLFLAQFDKPPLTWLTDYRLGNVARSLEQSNRSLRELAKEVGYGTEFSLSRAFKRKFGVAPSEYRKRRAVGQDPIRCAA